MSFMNESGDPPTIKQLRSFGFLVGGGFGALAMAPVVLSGGHYHTFPLAISCVLLLAAIIHPAILNPVFNVWMTIGGFLGAINSRIILAVVYYALFTPIGIVRRFFGTNTIKSSFDPEAASYRELSKEREPSHMKRHF